MLVLARTDLQRGAMWLGDSDYFGPSFSLIGLGEGSRPFICLTSHVGRRPKIRGDNEQGDQEWLLGR